MHDKKVKQIEELLAKHDPIKLIKIGAPLDEYSHEAQDIYEHINRYNSVEKIHQIVYDIFMRSFDCSGVGSYDDYAIIASAIKKIIDPA